MNKGKAIGIVGVFGMAAISGMWPAYVVAVVAGLCIATLDEEKNSSDDETTIGLDNEDEVK